MSYADLIKELFEKSGLQVNDYAAAAGISITHMSKILNGSAPGSVKILEACARHANIDLQDYLVFPDPQNLTRKHAVLIKHLTELLGLTGSDVPEIVRTAISVWHRRLVRGKPKPLG